MWIGSEKSRFKIQRCLAGAVVVMAVFYLAVQIEAYMCGEVSISDVLGGLFLSALGGGMFYMANKW